MSNGWPYPWIAATEVDDHHKERLDVGDKGDVLVNDGGIRYLLGDGAGDYLAIEGIKGRYENRP